ncbi:hypothetical protein Nizo2257_2199 [Lactiplantibacillus plantarum]|nr:hypothetical protein Nizo2257_2199 [Lactiplantibacillus plantarum]KZT97956.1 hypothetical protein Nizo2258_1717 [Lactiplantibacillus plantarum]
MPSQRINAVLALVRWRSKHKVLVAPNTFRETARMADERPPNLVQLVADYFDAGSLNKALGTLSTLSRD